MAGEIPSREELQKALLSRCTREEVEKLSESRVAVAGLGGLGSNTAVFLARAGIGHLHLIDFDKVDITNLNRQHYFISPSWKVQNGSSEGTASADKPLAGYRNQLRSGQGRECSETFSE